MVGDHGRTKIIVTVCNGLAACYQLNGVKEQLIQSVCDNIVTYEPELYSDSKQKFRHFSTNSDGVKELWQWHWL